ncbi:hypothetical protein ACLMJK_001275 [Lecanora helva]
MISPFKVASLVTLAAPQLTFAVIVEWKYTTEFITRTGLPPTHTPMPNGLSTESEQGQTLSTATIPASSITPSTLAPSMTSAPPAGSAVMQIEIINHWPEPLSISYGDNEGLPGALGSPTAGPLGTSTEVVYPTGWAGRIYLGKTVNSANSKIEGSTTGANDIDVSYVDGYSVPVTCSVAGTPVSGCNLDLYAVSGNCTNMLGQRDVCLNPMQDVPDGPATNWFLPCQGAAYTFPNDNIANNGDTGDEKIHCCIGTKDMGCEAPERQGKGNNRASKAKRSVAEQPHSLNPNTAARAHDHLARHLDQVRSHRHGFARMAKDSI